jgi:hypothetical protein
LDAGPYGVLNLRRSFEIRPVLPKILRQVQKIPVFSFGQFTTLPPGIQ